MARFGHFRRADHVELRFRRHKIDQEQKGNIRVRTQDEVAGPQSGVRANGSAVALVVVVVVPNATLHESVPMASYGCGRAVRTTEKYSAALRAVGDVVAKYALHFLRIGGATTSASGEDIAERVIQREGNGNLVHTSRTLGTKRRTRHQSRGILRAAAE